MSHRGKNPRANTVQVYNGTEWVSYDALSFEKNVLTIPKSLWVDSDDSLGLTLDGANRRSLSPVYNGTGNPLIATKRIFAHRLGDAGGADPQVIELPKIVSGVSPLVITGPKSLLVVDILLGVTHNNGSTNIGNRFVATWSIENAGDFPYINRGVEALGNTVDADMVVTAGTVAESEPNEGAPTITVNYNGYTAVSSMRYMLDMQMHLMGIVE